MVAKTFAQYFIPYVLECSAKAIVAVITAYTKHESIYVHAIKSSQPSENWNEGVRVLWSPVGLVMQMKIL